MIKENNKAMTQGVIWRQLLVFFFPIMLGTLFQQLYTMADAMIVGNFLGKQALAAVGGTAAAIVNLLVGFFVGLASGASVVIAQYFGAGAKKRLGRSIVTAMALGVAGGLILMLGGIAASKTVLTIMQTPEDIFEDSLLYLNIYFTGMIPTAVYNTGAGILRAVGDAKRPLYYLLVSCAVNIVLDIVMITVFHMGIAGAAAATVISQWLSAVLVCIALIRQKDLYGAEKGRLKIDGVILGRMLYIGLPAAIQSAMYNIANLIVQTSINTFGTDSVAAWSAYSRVDGLYGVIVLSFGTAIMTFSGQNFGAGEYGRIKGGVKSALLMCGGATVVFSLASVIFARPVVGMFTSEPDVIRQGAFMIYVLVPFQIVYIFAEILSGAVRGAGAAITPMVITCVSVCVLRSAWLLCVVPVWHTMLAVLLCYPVTWAVSSLAFVIYYKRGKWVKAAEEK